MCSLQASRQSRGFKLVAAATTLVLRCTKRPLSPSSVISAKPADKWAVNRVNSGHMYRPVFNYLEVNPAKRSPSLHSTAAYPCLSAPFCFPLSGLSPLAYNCYSCIFNIYHTDEHWSWPIILWDTLTKV